MQPVDPPSPNALLPIQLLTRPQTTLHKGRDAYWAPARRCSAMTPVSSSTLRLARRSVPSYRRENKGSVWARSGPSHQIIDVHASS